MTTFTYGPGGAVAVHRRPRRHDDLLLRQPRPARQGHRSARPEHRQLHLRQQLQPDPDHRRRRPDHTNKYDAQGNLISSTDPLGQTVSFTYTGTDDRLASVTDANGNTTQYGYDGKGNLTSTTYADGTIESVAYDPVGNVMSSTNQQRPGHPVHLRCGRQGPDRDLRRRHADTFTYDAHGNLTSATDSTGTTTLTYDADDRLTQITYPSGLLPEVQLRLGRPADPNGRSDRLHGQLHL